MMMMRMMMQMNIFIHQNSNNETNEIMKQTDAAV